MKLPGWARNVFALGKPARDRELYRRFKEWEALPYPALDYPPGAPEAEVDGVDLALLDGDAAYVVSAFLDPSLLRLAEEPTVRKAALSDLNRVLPQLSENGRRYFGPLRDLVRLVDEMRSEDFAT